MDLYDWSVEYHEKWFASSSAEAALWLPSESK